MKTYSQQNFLFFCNRIQRFKNTNEVRSCTMVLKKNDLLMKRYSTSLFRELKKEIYYCY